jgi:hypothetical protein
VFCEIRGMAVTVTRDEARNDFDGAHDRAPKEPVRVTDGKETVYVVSAEIYDALKQAHRRSLSVEELTEAAAGGDRRARLHHHH